MRLSRTQSAVFMAFAGAIALAAEPAVADTGVDASENAVLEAYHTVRAAMALRDVPLSIHPTCSGAAPQSEAKTVGDYLAGFLAAMDSGHNRITTRCRKTSRISTCELWLKHADDEDEWGWGILFAMNERGKPNRSSIRCLGSG